MDEGGESLLYEAFCAGAQWIEGRVVAQGGIGAAESTDTLKGNAESRTLIAALQLFIEQVLQGNPEEVGSGEWLSAAEAAELVKRIERTQ